MKKILLEVAMKNLLKGFAAISQNFNKEEEKMNNKKAYRDFVEAIEEKRKAIETNPVWEGLYEEIQKLELKTIKNTNIKYITRNDEGDIEEREKNYMPDMIIGDLSKNTCEDCCFENNVCMALLSEGYCDKQDKKFNPKELDEKIEEINKCINEVNPKNDPKVIRCLPANKIEQLCLAYLSQAELIDVTDKDPESFGKYKIFVKKNLICNINIKKSNNQDKVNIVTWSPRIYNDKIERNHLYIKDKGRVVNYKMGAEKPYIVQIISTGQKLCQLEFELENHISGAKYDVFIQFNLKGMTMVLNSFADYLYVQAQGPHNIKGSRFTYKNGATVSTYITTRYGKEGSSNESIGMREHGDLQNIKHTITKTKIATEKAERIKWGKICKARDEAQIRYLLALGFIDTEYLLNIKLDSWDPEAKTKATKAATRVWRKEVEARRIKNNKIKTGEFYIKLYKEIWSL